MPVRRIRNSKLRGYGVVGSIVSTRPQYTEIDMNIEAESIPINIINPGDLSDPYLHHVIFIHWRLKVSILIADIENIKQYHNPSGKLQYGRYVCKAREYVTHEDFVSYADIMSAGCRCVVIRDGGQVNDDLPCDDPPISLDVEPLVETAWIPYTSVVNDISSSSWGFYDGAISADKAVFYPESAVQTYSIGISYDYFVVPYTQSAWEQWNYPPVTLQ